MQGSSPKGERGSKGARRIERGKNRQQNQAERGLRPKKGVKKGLARGGVAGGDAVTRDFGPWRGPAGADWEQFSSEERERIGGRLSEESTAGENGVGEIDAVLILG